MSLADLLDPPLFAQAVPYAGTGLQTVLITLAAYGWWTWTHGGGPGATTLARALTGHGRAHGGAWRRTAYVAECGREHSARTLAEPRETTGPPETRPARAVAAVDEPLATAWDFAAPLPEKR